MTNSNEKKDAIDLLKADHRAAESLFDRYAKTEGNEKKREIAREACAALLIHMEIEEAIFYPAARRATGDEGLLDEAESEHAGARDIIAKLEHLQHEQGPFDTLVKQLQAEIEHHVDEEEKELFPKVRETKLDLAAIGDALLEMKNHLLKMHAMPAEA